MAAVDVTGIQEALRALSLEQWQAVGDAFGEGLRSRAPRRTGELHDSIEVGGAVMNGDQAHIVVAATAEHATFTNEGTGVYGPDGHIIESSSGGPLAFDWPAAGGMVIVMSVKGSPGSHWWDDTVADWPNIVASAL